MVLQNGILALPNYRSHYAQPYTPYPNIYYNRYNTYVTPDTRRAYEIAGQVNEIHTKLHGEDSGYIQTPHIGDTSENKPIQGYLYYYRPVPYRRGKKSSKSWISFSPSLFTGFFMGPLILLAGLSVVLPLGGITVELAGRDLARKKG